MNDEIDVVITWVDGNDPEWRIQKNKYMKEIQGVDLATTGEERYRDWDNLRYLFRGIENFMPYVRTIHLVTCGQTPVWLNTENPKLHLVKHADFMPEEYLPTFNSNSIELSLYRIQGLAEHFVNFNDDMFVLKPTKPEDFFERGLPKDIAVLSPQPVHRNIINNIDINNLEILNDYFTMNDIKKNHAKWFNVKYGTLNIRNCIFTRFTTIIGLYEPHIPYSYNKSIIQEVWEKEYQELDHASAHKFRNKEDENEWLFRGWQLLSGHFLPRDKSFGRLINLNENYQEQIQGLKKNPCTVVCLNDTDQVKNFEETKKTVNEYLNSLLSEKSSFEK